MKTPNFIKGRGAQSQVHNKFFKLSHEERDDFLNYCAVEDEDRTVKTTFIETFPKSIINKVTSPDVGMSYSLNPYQGCEHGCVYCYARNSHEYWGYGAGIDFESKILIKKTAPQLLEKKLQSKSWKAATIALSGNTDCYQPIEKSLKITRQLLKVFLKYKRECLSNSLQKLCKPNFACRSLIFYQLQVPQNFLPFVQIDSLASIVLLQ